MKVVSTALVLGLLELKRSDADAMVRVLEVNHKYKASDTSEYDLKLARSNLSSIEKTMQIIERESMEATSFDFSEMKGEIA